MIALIGHMPVIVVFVLLMAHHSEGLP